MVKKSELYIPLAELTKVGFACDHCGALVVVDMSNDEQRRNIIVMNKSCSICGYRFQRDLFSGFADLLAWIQKATDSKHAVYYIINGEALASTPPESK